MESSEIYSFLPFKIEDKTLLKYINYHIQQLDESIKHSLDYWIYLHTHILYMIFIYFQILRISQIKEKEFKYSWIWLPVNEKEFLKNNLNPLSFSFINEKTVFRFFRLLDFDDWFIWNISKCVKDRNKILHASWTHINEIDKIDNIFYSYIKNMELIVEKSKDFILNIFEKFENNNQIFFEEWYNIWYFDLELNLLIPYYISYIELEKIIEWKKEDKVVMALQEHLF